MLRTLRHVTVGLVVTLGLAGIASTASAERKPQMASEVLDWNQIFVDTLIATNTANAASPRLGAIVHTAIFDAYNGIEHRYTPIFVDQRAPDGASRRAAVAQAVLAWRATDGFSASYPPFTGGTAVGQWRPTPPAFGPMSAQGLAFTTMFVLVNNTQFEPGPPRTLTSATYTDDFNAVKALGRQTGSARSDDQTALALFWDGNASVHWNQAANQIARANHLSTSDANRLLAFLNIAMADTAFTTWAGKRFYGSVPTAVTWRPVTAIPLADTDGNPSTAADPGWLPLISTPSHPEYSAGHPSLNGVGATVLLSQFGRHQTFTLTTIGQPSRTYTSIAQARSDGDNARVWGGMHYPSTVAISDALGEAIAKYVDRNSMTRLHARDLHEFR